ncbi:MAG: N-6 DNA methylase [Pseudomonadota bacterium]
MAQHHIRRCVEAIWAEFWRSGLYEPVEIMEQMLYLLFLRRFDDLQARRLVDPRHAPPGPQWSPAGAEDHLMRWSRFKHLRAAEMYALLVNHVFPRLRCLGGPGSAYAQHMKGVRFSIPNAAALARLVTLIEALPRHAGPGGCAAYDYIAGKLAGLGQRGQYYTPPDVARLMVALVAPRPGDIVCSPVGGDGNFLVGVGEYLAQCHPALFAEPRQSEHFHHRMFHAYDADRTMLRIACMNLAMHGVTNPDIRYTNSVAADVAGEEDRYSIVLAHPSTACLREQDAASTAHAEIVMVGQFLRMLKRGGRAAVIVPQHILSGFSPDHLELRRRLVEEQQIDAVITFSSGLSGKHDGAAKSILLFTRTDCGGSDPVRFYDARCDGSVADAIAAPQRQAQRGGMLRAGSAAVENGRKHVPDLMLRWRRGGVGEPIGAAKSACLRVRQAQIAGASNCLSANRYRPGGSVDG